MRLQQMLNKVRPCRHVHDGSSIEHPNEPSAWQGIQRIERCSFPPSGSSMVKQQIRTVQGKYGSGSMVFPVSCSPHLHRIEQKEMLDES